MSNLNKQIKNVGIAIKNKSGIGCLVFKTKNQYDYVFLETSSKFDYNAAKL